jgi:hypothetical protein
MTDEIEILDDMAKLITWLSNTPATMRAGLFDIPQEKITQMRRYVDDRRRAAQVLLFQDAGCDERGLQRWRVGTEADPIEFVTRSDGVRLLHWLASNLARPLSVTEATDAVSGAKALRGKLTRGCDEIERHCRQLAVELRTFRETGECFVYTRRPVSPAIFTEPTNGA